MSIYQVGTQAVNLTNLTMSRRQKSPEDFGFWHVFGFFMVLIITLQAWIENAEHSLSNANQKMTLQRQK